MKEEQDQFNRLFVGGDLSGIQSFLYNISSKRAAVSLKGRSYYLSKFMEEAYIRTRDAIVSKGGTVTADDELYCSGGKFFMTASVDPQHQHAVSEAIDHCLSEIRQELWQEHKAQLGFNMCHVAFNEKDDVVDVEGKYHEPPFFGTEKGPGHLWKVVSSGFAQQKNQKFRDIILDNYNDFFGKGRELKVGPGHEVCAITGIEFDSRGLKDKDYHLTKDEGNEAIVVLPSVKKQVNEGYILRNEQGFKTFEEYAKDSYLGVLRMDVDGLGELFINGFQSFAQYKAFSGRLSSFFEEHVEKSLLLEKIKGRESDIYKDYLNVIYAGGDDLFIVGKWDIVIEFAHLIHDKATDHFKDKGLTISGGVAIVKPKFPIAKAAQMAGDAEEASKKYNGKGKKNAFTMFGITVSWNQEFDWVESYKNRFVDCIEKSNLSKSLLHKIMLYYSIVQNNKERKINNQSEDYSYFWHMSYYLHRFKKRYSGNKAVEALCSDLSLLTGDIRKLELMALAARWAELTTREK